MSTEREKKMKLVLRINAVLPGKGKRKLLCLKLQYTVKNMKYLIPIETQTAVGLHLQRQRKTGCVKDSLQPHLPPKSFFLSLSLSLSFKVTLICFRSRVLDLSLLSRRFPFSSYSLINGIN